MIYNLVVRSELLKSKIDNHQSQFILFLHAEISFPINYLKKVSFFFDFYFTCIQLFR